MMRLCLHTGRWLTRYDEDPRRLKHVYGFLVLIVGCGDLGSRHLQAVASLSQVREIELVDPRPEALELGRQRLAETPNRSPATKIRWLSSLEQATKGGDLCIVATQAQGRHQLVQDVVQSLGYSNFILEKIVAQSVEEIERMAEYNAERGLSTWVNCPLRAFEFHHNIKAKLNPDEPITFSAVGGNHGLATVGIHRTDLFAFYDGTGHIENAGSRIDPILHPSKRGEELFDLSGTLHGYTDKGSTLTVTYSNRHPDNYEHLTVATPSYRCVVDHMQQWAMESDSESNGAWRPVQYQSEILVSETTRQFASDILSESACALPTLEDSLVAHRFVLGTLQPHFGRLLNREIDHCPVT
jgi:predicted dehydrogenase